MLTSDFNYFLPQNLIAQTPIRPRDHSRLLVYERKVGKIHHQRFFDLPKFLQKGDLLVFNDTKVFKARLFGEIVSSIKNQVFRVEIFLLRPRGQGQWEILARPGKKLKIGVKVQFSKNLFCQVKEKKENGIVIVRFNKKTKEVIKQTEKLGHIPVPPYIKKEPTRLSDYQTIYAKHLGSVAAPTAGFHFTPRLLKKIKKMGVQIAFVTLHVGLGTFQPVKTRKIKEHQMPSEWVEILPETAKEINRAKSEGRRVIAVGTTSVRALEGVAQNLKNFRDRRYIEINKDKVVHAYGGDIDIFITPGFKFRVIDGLITNFHLPQSTLLMLVSAFIGNREKTLQIYKSVIQLKYRFYSFGDAMFIF